MKYGSKKLNLVCGAKIKSLDKVYSNLLIRESVTLTRCPATLISVTWCYH